MSSSGTSPARQRATVRRSSTARAARGRTSATRPRSSRTAPTACWCARRPERDTGPMRGDHGDRTPPNNPPVATPRSPVSRTSATSTAAARRTRTPRRWSTRGTSADGHRLRPGPPGPTPAGYLHPDVDGQGRVERDLACRRRRSPSSSLRTTWHRSSHPPPVHRAGRATSEQCGTDDPNTGHVQLPLELR